MIQRIQTLYLLIVTVLTGLMLAFPLGKFLAADNEFVLKAFGIYHTGTPGEPVVPLVYMGILVVMATALPLVTIFLYKRRLLQIRLCFMQMVFLIGVQIYVLFYLYRAAKGIGILGETSVVYSLVDIFPIASLILMWLAFRAIARDEALVRSLDRIR